MVKIRGNVVQKTMKGKSANYAPICREIHGQFEVSFNSVFYLWIILILNQVRCIEKLLTHLPVAGCRYCIGANPRKKFGVSDRCICDDLFLTPLPSLHWRASHITWYGRERRGENWFKSIIETISMYAGLSQRYTNSFCRPSSITALSHAEYSNREIAEFTGQKNPTIIEQYKKQVKMLTPEAKRNASMLMTASGRETLRGKQNKFGEVGEASVTGLLGRKHRAEIQKERSVEVMNT